MTGTLADRLSAHLDTVEALAKAEPEAFNTTMPPDRVLALINSDQALIQRHKALCVPCRAILECVEILDRAVAWGVE